MAERLVEYPLSDLTRDSWDDTLDRDYRDESLLHAGGQPDLIFQCHNSISQLHTTPATRRSVCRLIEAGARNRHFSPFE